MATPLEGRPSEIVTGLKIVPGIRLSDGRERVKGPTAMNLRSTFSIIHPDHDSPRLAADDAAWHHRLHYAQERDGYRALCRLTTVRDVARFVRGERPYPLGEATGPDEPAPWRDHVLVDLLDANRDAPHPVWSALLVIAFEDDILQARLALGATPDANHDRRVLAAFEASVAALSRFEEIAESVRLVSRGLHERIAAWMEARRRHREIRRARPAPLPRVDRDGLHDGSRRHRHREPPRRPRRFTPEPRPEQRRARRITGRRGAAYRRARRGL